MSDAVSTLNGARPRRVRKAADKVVRRVKGETQDLAAAAEDLSEKTVGAAAKRLRARREAVRLWARRRGEAAGQVVQTRPATTIATAIGVGVIIGLLARR